MQDACVSPTLQLASTLSSRLSNTSWSSQETKKCVLWSYLANHSLKIRNGKHPCNRPIITKVRGHVALSLGAFWTRYVVCTDMLEEVLSIFSSFFLCPRCRHLSPYWRYFQLQTPQMETTKTVTRGGQFYDFEPNFTNSM